MSAQTMVPDSKAFQMLYLLVDGPATTADVVAETNLPARLAHCHLSNLVKRGKVSRSPFQLGQCRVLWSITDKGRQAVRAAIALIGSAP